MHLVVILRYMDFDAEGQITMARDFFDFAGVNSAAAAQVRYFLTVEPSRTRPTSLLGALRHMHTLALPI